MRFAQTKNPFLPLVASTQYVFRCAASAEEAQLRPETPTNLLSLRGARQGDEAIPLIILARRLLREKHPRNDTVRWSRLIQ
jgi:hypothetical protein